MLTTFVCMEKVFIMHILQVCLQMVMFRNVCFQLGSCHFYLLFVYKIKRGFKMNKTLCGAYLNIDIKKYMGESAQLFFYSLVKQHEH